MHIGLSTLLPELHLQLMLGKFLLEDDFLVNIKTQFMY